jgi:hypothetical protein
MKLIKALARYPGTRIFRVEHSEVDQANWEAEPIDSAVLLESEDFYIVKAKHILSNGAIQDCYMDISLPERINDYTYFFNGESLNVFVNRKTDHFNHEKPSSSAVCMLKIHNEKPTIFTSKNRPVAKISLHGRIMVLERRIGQR